MTKKLSPSEIDALLVRLIQGVAVFAGLDRPEVVRLLGITRRTDLATNECLFSEGDRGRSMYVVISGSLLVSRRRDDGKDVRLAEIGPGESIGEIAMLESAPRSATVSALQNATVLEFQRDPVDSDPTIPGVLYLNIARILADRLRRTNGELLAHPLSSTTIDLSRD